MAEAPRSARSAPSDGPRTPAVDELVSVVRVHLDRVHDAVRRVGCGPDQSVDVVETSAVELVEAVATTPEAVDDAVGWWFARARARAHRVATGSDAPVGGGLLAVDDDQSRLAEALERLPERERVALLLRDSYDLPAASVGAALGLDADAGMGLVASARLALLPLVDDEPAPAVAPHADDLAALGRLGEGGPLAPRDATVRRHVLACASCRAVVEAQSRAHLRLSGLTVVALPERARTRVLSRVERAARRLLPATAAVPVAEPSPPPATARDAAPLLSPLVVGLALVVAALAGAAIGLLLTDRSDPRPVAGVDATLPARLPLVSPPPSPPLPTAEVPTVAEVRPRTTVVVVPPPAPPPPPPAPPSPSPSPTPTTAATLALAPVTGPNGTELSVSGAGFEPGAQVQVDYLDAEGEPTGSQAQVEADEDGTFTAQLVAQDPADEPGPHVVVASDGTSTARATFTAEA